MMRLSVAGRTCMCAARARVELSLLSLAVLTLAALMNDHLGTQFDIIHGYSGREEVYLAMERGYFEEEGIVVGVTCGC